MVMQVLQQTTTVTVVYCKTGFIYVNLINFLLYLGIYFLYKFMTVMNKSNDLKFMFVQNFVTAS